MVIRYLAQIPQLVYHGTTTEHIHSIEKIRVDFGRKDLDFGQGFYTTSVRKQAEEWALDKSYGSYKPLLLTYIVNCNIISKMNGLIYHDAGNDWANFIYNNRMETYNEVNNYDYVYGHMADGKIQLLLEDIKSGIKSYKDFKKEIYPTNCDFFYYDQLLFKSEYSLTALEKINMEVLS